MAFSLQFAGFNSLTEMRNLERTPRSQVVSIITGEVNLSGSSQANRQTISAPYTGTKCIYFYYHKERKEVYTDSDGNRQTRWVTVEQYSRQVPEFQLVDPSGGVTVITENADFSVPSETYYSGNYRHTEARFEPGEETFLFGYANQTAESTTVGFTAEGDYTPIVSTYGEVSERADMASGGIWMFSFALLSLSCGIMFSCWFVGIHRLLVFLTIVSMIQGVGLVLLGLQMMQLDLGASHSRILRQIDRAEQEFERLFVQANVRWSGNWNNQEVFNERLAKRLADRHFKRVQGIYGDMAANISRFNQVRNRFPEHYLAPVFGIKPIPELPLAKSFAPQSAEQLSIQSVSVNFLNLLFMLGGGGLVAISGTFVGFRKIKEKRYIENIPTSLSTGLAYGPAEIQGTVERKSKTLTGPLSDAPCVQYHYVVKEKRGSGKKAKWVTITNQTQLIDFYCRDSEGIVPVNLDGAEIHTRHSLSRRSGRRRYSETSIRIDDPLYVLGTAVIDESTGDRLMIAKGKNKFPLITTNYTETELMGRKSRRGLFGLNLGLNGFVLVGFGLLGAAASYAATDFLFASLIAPLFLAGCFVGLMYNDLVFVRNRVLRAWSNIGVSLKKRADLIPNLVKIAKEYLKHEKQLQTDLAKLRECSQRAVDFDPAAAGIFITQEVTVMQNFFGLQEKYPDLKGNKMMAQLHEKFVLLENEVALMRSGYNDSVERHNTRIGQIPEFFLAKLFNFKEADLFHAELEVVENIQRPVNAKQFDRLPPIIKTKGVDKPSNTEGEKLELPPIIRHTKEDVGSVIMYCDNCNQKLEVPGELIGNEIQCPECHHKEIVPNQDESEPPNPSSPKV
ncbi:MAG: LemA family protein [Verrucomicrobiota bacterium]|nr:LemA family protein [Verrucomicrobiota bacterium]